VILEIGFQGASANQERVCQRRLHLHPAPELGRVGVSRLERRGEDSSEIIDMRMKNAQLEVAQVGKFDFVIINELFDRALFDLKAIVHSQRLKISQPSAARVPKHSQALNVLLAFRRIPWPASLL